MEQQPTRRKGAGWMLHMAEMAVVQDVHTRQPAEVQAQAEALHQGQRLARGRAGAEADQATADLIEARCRCLHF